ncbi:MAG: DUF3394 domain-containing protein [Desulfobacter sp.]|nr:DUF3394 domain-containing protein [Desulfobacter sp.]WDP86044.1 MAG: DUF3394 domain-containing protein [Desulfobacter sp.]
MNLLVDKAFHEYLSRGLLVQCRMLSFAIIVSEISIQPSIKRMTITVGFGINVFILEGPPKPGKVLVDNVVFSSNAEKMGIDFDQEILQVKLPSDRPPKQIMFIPALALMALIYLLQKKRKERLGEV